MPVKRCENLLATYDPSSRTILRVEKMPGQDKELTDEEHTVLEKVNEALSLFRGKFSYAGPPVADPPTPPETNP